MRRALLTIFAVVWSISAGAQLKVLSEAAPATTITKIYTDPSDTHHSLVEIKSSDVGFVLSAATTNRYDGRFVLLLGQTGGEAVQTLRDLAALCDTQDPGTVLTLEMFPGKTCRLSVLDKNGRAKGKPALLVFGADDYAGIVMIKPKQVLRLADNTQKALDL